MTSGHQLAQLAAQGLTAREIARLLKCSPSTVRRHAAKAGIALTPGKSRLGVSAVVVDGERYGSPAELRRWRHLQLLEKAGRISHLQRQVPFRIEVNGELICTYFADATYFENQTNKSVIEDTKGKPTEVYKLKRKLVKAMYPGREFREVRV